MPWSSPDGVHLGEATSAAAWPIGVAQVSAAGLLHVDQLALDARVVVADGTPFVLLSLPVSASLWLDVDLCTFVGRAPDPYAE